MFIRNSWWTEERDRARDDRCERGGAFVNTQRVKRMEGWAETRSSKEAYLSLLHLYRSNISSLHIYITRIDLVTTSSDFHWFKIELNRPIFLVCRNRHADKILEKLKIKNSHFKSSNTKHRDFQPRMFFDPWIFPLASSKLCHRRYHRR